MIKQLAKIVEVDILTTNGPKSKRVLAPFVHLINLMASLEQRPGYCTPKAFEERARDFLRKLPVEDDAIAFGLEWQKFMETFDREQGLTNAPDGWEDYPEGGSPVFSFLKSKVVWGVSAAVAAVLIASLALRGSGEEGNDEAVLDPRRFSTSVSDLRSIPF